MIATKQLNIDEVLKMLKSGAIKPQEPTADFLNVINKVDDESTISKWIAFLLNAKISREPLIKFAEYFDIEVDGNCEIDVMREYYLQNRRRIDVVIKTPNHWFVIENKINSDEQKGQTKDYREFIEAELKETNELEGGKGNSKGAKYIYLKPNYNTSTPESEYFAVLTYGELYDMWKGIDKSSFANQDNYVYFT